jgi:2-succinyl-6-hydroxy-2,4-cyclohexadiene-1-carboxylate synthase
VSVIAADGVRLHAEAHGHGIPLLLSCAYCTTHENFRPQVEPLVRAGARVVLWDYRGHGRSEAPADPEAYSMARVVDDLGRVLDWAAPDEPGVLGGLSFGGLASLHLTLARPERVRGLVLVASGPGFKQPAAQARWEAMVERTAAFVEERGLEAFVASRASATLVGSHPERPAARAAARAIAAQDARGLALFGRRVSGLAPPVVDELARIRVPTLILVGEHDEAYHRAAEVMEARIPAARRVVVPGAGHILNLEAPEAFDRLVAEFLAALPDLRARASRGR